MARVAFGSVAHMIRLDLTTEQLRAVVDVVGKRVSETNEQDTPLEQAERVLDSALLADEARHEDMAAEFTENGLDDVAEHLREHGLAATRRWIDGEIAEAAENDDPEGWRLGNLEVARDRLVYALTPNDRQED